MRFIVSFLTCNWFCCYREATRNLYRSKGSSRRGTWKAWKKYAWKTVQLEQQEETINELNEQYNKFKTLLEQEGFSVSRRQNTSITYEMVTNVNSSTRYRRRHETKNVLEFIHGGKEGALYGAWGYASFSSDNQTMDKVISRFKWGKYLQCLLNKTMNDYQNSEESIKQAVLMKYQNFLTRRKYALVCKTQASVFDPNSDLWVPRNMKCLGTDLRIPCITISDKKVERVWPC